MNCLRSAFIIMTGVISVFSTEFSITGIVKDSEGNVIENALIRFEKAGYVTVSNTSGEFILSEVSPVVRPLEKITSAEIVGYKNGYLHFTVTGSEKIVFSAYSLQGKQCFKKQLQGLTKGGYRAQVESILPSEMKSGTYIITTSIGKKMLATKVLHRADRKSTFAVQFIDNLQDMQRLARTSSMVDTVTISKLGYVAVSKPVESYQANIGTIILQKSVELNDTAVVGAIEDSLMNLFIERIQAIENLNGPDELKTIDYISIRNGFEAILEMDSLRVKSNIGFMLSALASLNVNSEVWKIADSLDEYFSAMNSEEFSEEESMLMKKAMKKGGVLALGKALVVKTPQIVMTGVQNPSFPSFLTISYLQDLIETHLLPVLNKAQAAAERIEGVSDASMKITVENDQYEVDKGEVYLFDASVNLLRAYCYMICTYDMDLFTSSEKKNYSWIDTLVNNDEEYKHIYSIAGDTLYEIKSWGSEEKNIKTLVQLLHYNLEERSEFMTLRRSFHEVAFNCLKAVPYKIKNGLAAIKAETDDQGDDLLKIAMIDSANAEMLDMSSEIEAEGFSASFAQHFSSIDKLMDFIIQLQSGPYTFDETIEGKHIGITVNLQAMFTNPVSDLRTLLPAYSWTNESDWVKSEIDRWENEFYQLRLVYNSQSSTYDTLYYISNYNTSDEPIFMFDTTLIDSVVDSDWGDKKYYISTPLRYHVTIDSTYYFDALRLKDGDGNVMSSETIDSLIDAREFFPWFSDYTLNGVFPNMTRAKWLDLIWSE